MSDFLLLSICAFAVLCVIILHVDEIWWFFEDRLGEVKKWINSEYCSLLIFQLNQFPSYFIVRYSLFVIGWILYAIYRWLAGYPVFCPEIVSGFKNSSLFYILLVLWWFLCVQRIYGGLSFMAPSLFCLVGQGAFGFICLILALSMHWNLPGENSLADFWVVLTGFFYFVIDSVIQAYVGYHYHYEELSVLVKEENLNFNGFIIFYILAILLFFYLCSCGSISESSEIGCFLSD